MSEQKFIPFHLPSVDNAEIDAVVATLRSGWLTTGPRAAQFEKEFKEFVRAPYALAVNSCTAGLHLALAGLELGPGDEVITTPLTFCATVNSILHTGATAILADIGPDGNIDPLSIRERISVRTRAIIPVHYAGLPCDMDAIWSLARHRELAVVEDAAHATGARYKGQPIGAGNPAAGFSSDAVAFSFYATKNLSTGEGGMVTSHDEELMNRMRILCLHGISRDAWNRYAENGKWYYEVVDCGFKYNLSDIQAAIGVAQLHKQEQFLKARTACARSYNDAFAGMPEFELPPDSPQSTHAWHLYSLRLNLDRLSIDRAQFMEELRLRGVGASVHFIPIPEHPYFAARPEIASAPCPVAAALYPRLVSLPLYPALSAEQLARVVDSVKAIAHKSKRKKTFAAA
jgi:dTDP-4-amino-4,6-dideoxygalactose transaminase